MIPADFPEANAGYKAPPGLEESQVATIPAWAGQAESGSCDGVKLIVVAWTPTPEELETIKAGGPIFLTVLGNGLPAHFLSTDFNTATHPA